jgi:hypothetical protein
MGCRTAVGTNVGTDRPQPGTTKAPLRVVAGPLAWAFLPCALGGTRTPNLLIRSQMLSPIELRAPGWRGNPSAGGREAPTALRPGGASPVSSWAGSAGRTGPRRRRCGSSAPSRRVRPHAATTRSPGCPSAVLSPTPTRHHMPGWPVPGDAGPCLLSMAALRPRDHSFGASSRRCAMSSRRGPCEDTETQHKPPATGRRLPSVGRSMEAASAPPPTVGFL